jgi:hypothetical protein
LRDNPKVLRVAQRWALSAAVSVLAAGLTFGAKPALAEFEIQEAQIEKGEVQLSYRGAVHSGLPAGEEEPPLRQSHEFEAQYSVTDWWLLSLTFGADQPNGEDFGVNAVEFEAQYQLIERQGDEPSRADTRRPSTMTTSRTPMRSASARSSSWPRGRC